MHRTSLSRRRFLAVSAALAGSAAWPGRGQAAAGVLVEWRGVALGALASIRLAHPDQEEGRALLKRCVSEIERLERIFSLYRTDSALCRLNAEGALDLPPLELVELLSIADEVSAASGGAFDVTVQPLWQRSSDHFKEPDADPSGPKIEDVLRLVGWSNLSVRSSRIAFARRGMAVTLNGIAQGFITDRMAALLRDEGMDSVLIDLGETRAVGGHPGGAPWRVGLADPTAPGRVAARLELRDTALATSGGYGMTFEPTGRYNHLIDPRNGRSVPPQRAVSVLAPSATIADAASTALALLPESEAPWLLRRLGASTAYIQDTSGLRVLRA